MKNALLFILFFSQLSYAQIGNSIFPEVPYSALGQIAVEGDYIYTAGDCNVGMVSTNAGQDWEIINLDDYADAIQVMPNSGGQKALYMTRDDVFALDVNTLQFEKVSSSSLTLQAGRLRGMHVTDDKVYVISGTGIFESPYGDYNWTKSADLNFDDINDYVNSSDKTNNFIYVGSNLGEVKKMNLSTNEVVGTFNIGDRISKIEMGTDDVGYMDVNGQSSFVRTINGGTSWGAVNDMPESINPVAYGENVIMSVNTNRLYVSLDGGETSTYVPIPEDGYFDLISNAFMSEDGVFYAAGRSNMIIKSEDFADSFINLNRYKRADLEGIKLASNGTGYAVGSSGTVIKTEDGGDTWFPIDLGLSFDTYLSNIAVYNDGRLVLNSDSGIFIYQDDVLVNEVPNPTSRMHQSTIGDVLIGLQSIGGSSAIAVSTDRGDTWETKAMIPSSYYQIHQSPTGKIYIPNGEDIMYTSEDNGANWDIEDLGLNSVREVSFLDDQIGLLVSGNKIFKTTDGGLNALEVSQANGIFNVQYFNEDQMLFTVSQNSMTAVKVSENGGSSFTTEAEFCSTTRGSFFDGSKTIWLSQRGGHINKYEFSSLPTSTSSSLVQEFNISPNPVKFGELLTFDLPIQESVDLNIYNIGGQVVYSADIQGNINTIALPNLEEGYYIVDLQTDGKKWISKLIVQ